ncbi:MAG: o-succinylbenzoate synthase [Chloroflexota bacterium]|nr:o-succinylbenzoate synthase [Chloroflexota bacterium]
MRARNATILFKTSMQRIKNIHWYPYRIPLRSRFTTAHGSLSRREGAIIEVITEDGLFGVGESAPLPEFAGDDLETALVPLPTLSAQLHGKTLAEALALLYTSSAELPATIACGLEGALLDAIGKQSGHSISALLSSQDSSVGTRFIASGDSSPAPKNAIPVNAVIGALPLNATITRAQELIAAGFQCIKLKVGSDVDRERERVAAVRRIIGPSPHLRLDANEAWTFDLAVTILSQLAEYDLQYVEQPLPAGDLEGMHRLRRAVPIPIAADESVFNLKSTRHVLAHAAADILILKPQLIGGLRAAQQVIRAATEYGVRCVITSTIEAGVGVAGAVHLVAATPEVTLECGLATLSLLEDDLLLAGLAIQHGVLAVPTGPGLGVSLDRAALARYKIDEAYPIMYRRDYL